MKLLCDSMDSTSHHACLLCDSVDSTSHHTCLLCDSVDGVGEVGDVLGGDARNRDAPVLGQVHAEVLGQPLHLQCTATM